MRSGLLWFLTASICLFSSLLFSCAHSTRILSVPEGALVYVDGKALGKSPALYRYRSRSPGSQLKVQIKTTGPEGEKVTGKVLGSHFCTAPGNILLDLTLVGIFFGFCHDEEVLFDFIGAPKAAPQAASAAPSS